MGTELVVIPNRSVGRGRPGFAWTEEILDRLLEGLVLGRTLTEICEEQGMPGYYCVYNRRIAEPEFDNIIVHARREGVHAMVEQARIKAATPLIGRTVTHSSENGVTIKMEDAVARSRLDVETTLRLAGKLNAIYGDKRPGEDGPSVTNITNTVNNVAVGMTAQEAAEIFAEKRKAIG